MTRAALRPGTTGTQQTTKLENGTVHLRVRYRPLSAGPPVQVTAQGVSRAAAVRALSRNVALAEARSHAAAEALLAAQAALDREEVAAAAASCSVATLICELLAEVQAYRSVRPQTLGEYRRVTRTTIHPLIGDTAVSEWTAQLTSAWLLDVATKTPSLFKTVKTILNQSAALGIRHGRLGANPVAGIRNPKPVRSVVLVDGVEEEADPVITVEHSELEALRGALRELRRSQLKSKPGPKPDYQHISDLVEVLAATGLRIGEACALRWKSIDLDGALWRDRGLSVQAPSLVVEATVAWVRGEPAYVQPWTKSHDAYRVLYLADSVVELLRERRDLNDTMVFSGAKGGVWHPATARSQLRKVRALAGVRTSITPHAFRRTVATEVELASGLPAATAVMGHKSSAITGRHYVKRGAKVAPDTRSIMKAWEPRAE